MGKTHWTDEEENYIREHYLTQQYSEIADRLGIGYNSVRYKVRKMGLKKGSGNYNPPANRIPCNETFFDQYTPNSCYVLGFLLADGHVDRKRNRIRIGLSDKDRIILEYIQRVLAPYSLIRDSIDSKGYGKSDLEFSSRYLIDQLRLIGLDSSKSQSVHLFSRIPDHLKHHFIRGFFDGDGCISIRERQRGKYYSVEGKATLTNTDVDLLWHIQQYLKMGSIIDQTTWYTWQISSLTNIRHLYDYMYQDDSFYLPRKHTKFNQFFQMRGVA